MPNITISLDEDLLKSGRRYAEKHQTSMNALIRKLLEQTVRFQSDAWLEECFNLMDVNRVRHLPVVDDGSLVGMLSIRDLVRAIVDQQIFVSSQLENYITGRS